MRSLFVLFFMIIANSAFAGYAQLIPPPAFQSVGGVSTMAVGTAANGARYAGGYVVAEAGLSIGARAITVPVAFRVAANAATFAVTKLNPWLAGAQLAALAIPYVIDWINQSNSNLEVNSDGVIMVPGSPGGVIPAPAGDYYITGPDGTVILASQIPTTGHQCYSSYGWVLLACTNGTSRGYTKNCGGYGESLQCFPSAPDPTNPAIPPRHPTIDELGKLADGQFNPALLPLLDIPIPVDPVPVINPLTEPVGDPLIGPNGNPAPQLQPNPEPLRFPDGDPVPIPNTNPQTYSQPWYEVKPSPTPSNPWRVDVTQTVTETTNPNPQPDPTPTPDPKPNPVSDFYTDCDKYPGSLGCLPVDSVPIEQIPTGTRDITLQQGPSFNGGGTCPADLMAYAGGHSFKVLDMAQACSWIVNYVKPLLLLLAAISAVFIVAPRSEG